MAASLYEHDGAFTSAIDAVFASLGRDGDRLRSDWLAAEPILPIDHPQRSQPLLFAVDYAYSAVVRSWGITPSALLGHSVGEVVAAVIAGVLPMPEAARLVWDRMANLAHAAPGGMLAVAESAEKLTPYLRDDVVVGAVNAPRQTILAGSARPLAEIAADLEALSILCAPVASLTPFHSPALRSYAAFDKAIVDNIALRSPSIPIVSCYTGRILSDEQAVDPAYWASHPAAPVLFWPALSTLLVAGPWTLVETGPGNTLTRLARRHAAAASGGSLAVNLGGTRFDRDRGALDQARDAILARVAA